MQHTQTYTSCSTHKHTPRAAHTNIHLMQHTQTYTHIDISTHVHGVLCVHVIQLLSSVCMCDCSQAVDLSVSAEVLGGVRSKRWEFCWRVCVCPTSIYIVGYMCGKIWYRVVQLTNICKSSLALGLSLYLWNLTVTFSSLPLLNKQNVSIS